MTTILTILLLCSAAGSQDKAAQQSSKQRDWTSFGKQDDTATAGLINHGKSAPVIFYDVDGKRTAPIVSKRQSEQHWHFGQGRTLDDLMENIESEAVVNFEVYCPAAPVAPFCRRNFHLDKRACSQKVGDGERTWVSGCVRNQKAVPRKNGILMHMSLGGPDGAERWEQCWTYSRYENPHCITDKNTAQMMLDWEQEVIPIRKPKAGAHSEPKGKPDSE